MDAAYWENYYLNHQKPFEPSLFAKYIVENYAKKGNRLIELGCGNGRDSRFFIENGLDVTAVDSCKSEIEYLKKTISDTSFFYGDFTKLEAADQYDIIYSRFTMHSISENDEDGVLDWCQKSLYKNGYLCIEARGLSNELFGRGEPVAGEKNAHIYDNHYRRFISFDICNKLISKKFMILFAAEKRGFSPLNDKDEIFLRIVAQFIGHDVQDLDVHIDLIPPPPPPI